MSRRCINCKFDARVVKGTDCAPCLADPENKPFFEPVAEVIAAQAAGEPLSGAQGTGMKFDGGKPRWSLLMAGMSKALEGVAKVLTFGAQKYAAHSWRTVPEGKDRYRDALYRHLAAIEQGEELDPESGLRHWDHVICNALFLSELNR